MTYIVLTFAPWDLEIGFETKDDKEYYKIMDEIKDKFNDIVQSYENVLIVEEPRRKYLIKDVSEKQNKPRITLMCHSNGIFPSRIFLRKVIKGLLFLL